jgi:hypothetical protein
VGVIAVAGVLFLADTALAIPKQPSIAWPAATSTLAVPAMFAERLEAEPDASLLPAPCADCAVPMTALLVAGGAPAHAELSLAYEPTAGRSEFVLGETETALLMGGGVIGLVGLTAFAWPRRRGTRRRRYDHY